MSKNITLKVGQKAVVRAKFTDAETYDPYDPPSVRFLLITNNEPQIVYDRAAGVTDTEIIKDEAGSYHVDVLATEAMARKTFSTPVETLKYLVSLHWPIFSFLNG